MSSGKCFCPKIIFFNLGINHEASLASSIGDTSLEEKLNGNAVRQFEEYLFMLSSKNQLIDTQIVDKLFSDLREMVSF